MGNLVNKTKEQLIEKIDILKAEIAKFEKSKTEHNQAREALINSEDKIYSIFRAARAGIGIVKDRVIVDVNPRFCEITGYTNEELIGKNSFILYPSKEEYNFVGKEKYKQIAEQGVGIVETQFQKKDKSIIDILLSSTPIDLSDLSKGVTFTALEITGQKRVEKLLKESEKNFRYVLDNSAMTIYNLNLQTGTYDYLSPSVEKIFGYSMEEFKSKGFKHTISRIHPDDIKKINTHINNLLLKKIEDFSPTIEYRFKHPKLGYIWIRDIRAVIFDTNGNPESIIGNSYNITDQKQMELEQKQSEGKFKSLFESLGDAVFVTKLGGVNKGRILEVNSAALRQTGYSRNELLKMNIIRDLSISRSGEINTEDWEKKLNKGEIVTTIEKKRRKDNTSYWTEVIVAPIEFNGEKASLSINHDITDRRRAEETLLKSENNLRTIFNAMTDIVFELDYNGRYISIAPTATDLLFKPSEEMIGRTLHEVFPKPQADYFLEFVHKCLDENKETSIEYPLIIRGKTIWFEGRATPKTKNSILYIARDITKRKFAEVELLEAKEHAEESDRLKTAFLHNISHEIRTPMNGILGFINLLKERDLTGEQQQEYIQVIDDSGLRMLNLINDLINISQVEAGQVELLLSDVNINEQIEKLYGIFKPEAEKKGVLLLYKNALAKQEAIINTDQEKLYIVLINLIKNAIKYTNKGTIEVGYTLKKDTEPVITEQGRSVEVEFYVKDTGIGIPVKRQQAIFDRFVQADIEDKNALEGAGLGLSISKAYVEMIGGKIGVESSEMEGSRFYFTIPYTIKPEENTIADIKSQKKNIESQMKNMKILIAEDVESVDKYLTIVLKKISKEIFHSKTGIETIKCCRDNPDIDLILMDIKMPKMNGLEATIKIREFNKDVIIIAQTAYAFYHDREKAIEAGCNDYISKPFNKDKLFEIIEKYF